MVSSFDASVFMTDDYVYLDNAATTPVDPRVSRLMALYLCERFGNPSSNHGFGREAKSAIETARGQVAELLDANPSEVIFTSGGTEADNLALLLAPGIARNPERCTIVTSAAEHHAILKSCEILEKQGFDIVRLPVRSDATVNVDDVSRAVDSHTFLVSLMHVNNETGGVNDIETIGAIVRRSGAIFHCDAVQSFGKNFFSMKRFQTDLASVSSHKIHGPKGVGALCIRRGVDFPALLHGGSQEFGRRGGTENVPGIVAFGEAARLASAEHEDRTLRWKSFRTFLIHNLRIAFPAIIVNGNETSQANIVSISFPSRVYPLDAEVLMMSLDLNKLAVSSGSACASGSVKASHVMDAIGHDAKTGAATIRFSFGAFTTEADVRHGMEITVRTVQQMLG